MKDEFPTLYAPASNGKPKQWKVTVVDNKGHATIRRVHGFVGMKLSVSERDVYNGKNIGKRNETSYLEQAMFEAYSIFKKQCEKGYSTSNESTPPEENKMPLPMLAHDFNKRGHNIKRNCAIQPKIDGVRLVAHVDGDTVTMYSRTGKLVTILDHMKPDIIAIAKRSGLPYIDGEFFTDKHPFEEISGMFRKKKLTTLDKEVIKEVQYHVFDGFDPHKDISFTKRHELLKKGYRKEQQTIVLVPTEFLTGQSCTELSNAVKTRHTQFIAEGYEGAIVRNSDGFYKIGYRSPDLQKYKEFHDAEYKIVGGVEATGNDVGTVVFECATESGSVFNVRPRGTRETRRTWLQNIDSLVGKMLTVRYQELCENDIPRFGVGIQIRDYE